MKEIGNKISICRQNKNMTQEDLAKRLGVTSQAVSKWERGLSFPDVGILKELCNVLEVSADYLLNKILEFMQYKLLENPTASTYELSDAVVVGVKVGRDIS